MNKNSIIVFLVLIVAILLFIIFNKDIKTTSLFSQNINTSLEVNQDNSKIIKPEDNNVNIKNNVPVVDIKKTSDTLIYIEPETDPINFLIGSMGNQYKIMTSSSTPATITYTLKGSSAAVVPNTVVKDFSYTETVNVPIGLNKLRNFTSVAKPVLTYSVK